MNIRKKFKKLIIEKKHGLPYEEAIKKELVLGQPITLGIIIRLFAERFEENKMWNEEGMAWHLYNSIYKIWYSGSDKTKETTDDDQTKETIIKLYNLIKK